MLFVAFCPVVGKAEHLAVVFSGGASFAPSFHMIGIHFLFCPDFVATGFMAHGTQGTVADTSAARIFGLPFVNAPFGCIVKNADIQQSCVLLTT